jgi:putative acetyltransferase
MSADIIIKPGDLDSPAVKELLLSHLKNAAAHSPEEAIFALDLNGLKVKEISFWTAWHGEQLLGCGALKRLDENHAEIKSMHTLAASRGSGVGTRMIKHLLAHAKSLGVQRVSLETGTAPAYSAAHRLYQKHGFIQSEAFSDYSESKHSLYMSRRLD